MPAQNPDSWRLLCEAILRDAQTQRDEILNQARQQAESILAKARLEAGEIRQRLLTQAQAEGARRRELMLATVPVEAERMRLLRIEALLEGVLQAARHKLEAREGFDYPKAIAALVAEAVGRMAGDRFLIRLSPADQTAFGGGLPEQITQRLGGKRVHLTMRADPRNFGGGVIIEDEGGRQVWDNRLTCRLKRLWPDLRRRIAVETRILSAGGGA